MSEEKDLKEGTSQDPETVTIPTEVLAPSRSYRPGQFLPGHARMGGRKKGSVTLRNKMAREIAQSMNFDPIKMTIEIITTGLLPGKNPDGTKIVETVTVEERMKLLRDVQGYLQPRLSSVQVTGKDGGPIQSTTLDIADVLRDPSLLEAAQKLAFLMASKRDQNGDEDDDESDDEQTA